MASYNFIGELPDTLSGFTPMAVFHFHIRQGNQLLEDRDGSDLSGLDAALQHAREDARALIAERIRVGQLVERRSMEITDAKGLRMALVTFEEVLRELAPWIYHEGPSDPP